MVYLPTFTIKINHSCWYIYQSHGSYGFVQPKSWKCTSYQLERYMKVFFYESIRIFQPFDGPPQKKQVCHGQKSRFFGDGHPAFNRNPYNGYINPYYWVDDHPLLYGNNGSLDPGTSGSLKGLHVPVLWLLCWQPSKYNSKDTRELISIFWTSPS